MFAHTQDSIAAKLPQWTRPEPHSYREYHGPWIENYFYTHWLESHKVQEEIENLGIQYLPIFWTDIYVRGGRPKFLSNKLQILIEELIDPDQQYFTIVQHDLGTRIEVPSNVLVFGAGGVGDIPIPLLKRSRERAVKQKDIYLSFMGATTDASDYNSIRSKMLDIASCIDGFNFFESSSYSEYCDVMSRSKFTLCPRGFGATSFRLYESLALGSIPIYIWEDNMWLPYCDDIQWNNVAVKLSSRDIETLPYILEKIDINQLDAMSEYTSNIYADYFTYPGVCRWILEFLNQKYA